MTKIQGKKPKVLRDHQAVRSVHYFERLRNIHEENRLRIDLETYCPKCGGDKKAHRLTRWALCVVSFIATRFAVS